MWNTACSTKQSELNYPVKTEVTFFSFLGGLFVAQLFCFQQNPASGEGNTCSLLKLLGHFGYWGL